RGPHGRVLVAAVHVEAALAARVPLDRLGALEAEGGRLNDRRGDGRVGAFGRTGMHGDGGDLHAARSIARSPRHSRLAPAEKKKSPRTPCPGAAKIETLRCRAGGRYQSPGVRTLRGRGGATPVPAAVPRSSSSITQTHIVSTLQIRTAGFQ